METASKRFPPHSRMRMSTYRVQQWRPDSTESCSRSNVFLRRQNHVMWPSISLC